MDGAARTSATSSRCAKSLVPVGTRRCRTAWTPRPAPTGPGKRTPFCINAAPTDRLRASKAVVALKVLPRVLHLLVCTALGNHAGEDGLGRVAESDQARAAQAAVRPATERPHRLPRAASQQLAPPRGSNKSGPVGIRVIGVVLRLSGRRRRRQLLVHKRPPCEPPARLFGQLALPTAHILPVWVKLRALSLLLPEGGLHGPTVYGSAGAMAEEKAAAAAGSLRHIVPCVDGSEVAHKAFEMAKTFFTRRDFVTVLHCAVPGKSTRHTGPLRWRKGFELPVSRCGGACGCAWPRSGARAALDRAAVQLPALAHAPAPAVAPAQSTCPTT